MRLHLGGPKMKSGSCHQQHLDSKCGAESHETAPRESSGHVSKPRSLPGGSALWAPGCKPSRQDSVPLLSAYCVQALSARFMYVPSPMFPDLHTQAHTHTGTWRRVLSQGPVPPGTASRAPSHLGRWGLGNRARGGGRGAFDLHTSDPRVLSPSSGPALTGSRCACRQPDQALL